jgi:hypothetical protein
MDLSYILIFLVEKLFRLFYSNIGLLNNRSAATLWPCIADKVDPIKLIIVLNILGQITFQKIMDLSYILIFSRKTFSTNLLKYRPSE